MSGNESSLQHTLCSSELFTLRRWDVGRGNEPEAIEYVMPGSTDNFLPDARNPRAYYPMSQKHVHAWFMKELWTERVLLYGPAAIKMPQPLAWRVM